MEHTHYKILKFQTILYTNSYWAKEIYDMEKLSALPLWLAQYDVDVPVFDYPFFMWQYSNTGEIAGIEGFVDLNIMFLPKED